MGVDAVHIYRFKFAYIKFNVLPLLSTHTDETILLLKCESSVWCRFFYRLTSKLL